MSSSSMKTTATANFYLPEECWESVFTFLNDDKRCLECISMVSKQFLAIINCLVFSFQICDQTLPFIPRLFQRFPNLTSLDLTLFSKDGDIDELLYQISTFPLNLKTLKLSNQFTIPAYGLRALSKKITTLNSLTCSNIVSLDNDDLVRISDCFPFLEELDISSTSVETKLVEIDNIDVGLETMLTSLPKLRKVNIGGHYNIDYDSLLLHLCKSCEFLEEVVIFDCSLLTHNGIASAIRERPGLRSLSFTEFGGLGNSSHFINSLVSLKGLNCLNLSYSAVTDELLSSIAEEGLPLRRLVLSGCSRYTYAGIFKLLSKCQSIQYLDLQSAHFLKDSNFVELSLFLVDLVSIDISDCSRLTIVTLSALLRNCSKLNEVKMEGTGTTKYMGVENSSTLMNLVVNPQLKSLHLSDNKWLTEKHVHVFASILPNLQLLDLSWCCRISEKGIGLVLKRCSKIRQLSIVYSQRLEPLRMNFKVSTLEVLNLSRSKINDKSLNVISKSCFRLLQLDLSCCLNVTEKGVRQALENCTQLREINLTYCTKVAVDVVDSMLFIRPTLRKITPPPHFCCTESKRKLFSSLGCRLIC
ncbi:F-box/LRR-repeat protein [Trifolium pratense]|uniref:F-box/LRR-repeat protein n=1 Tax=Trifolium pratense TaxID=57577 RepID=A0A2K3N7B4_TRIPR|nr:F-box/LRR-repeat protein [Trifolium pratense]